jgi:hypothetical protein
MEKIAFNQLKTMSCAIMDAGSGKDLFDRDSFDYLQGTSREWHGFSSQLRKDMDRGLGLSAAVQRAASLMPPMGGILGTWQILEYLICYDFIVFDQNVLVEFQSDLAPDSLLYSSVFRCTEIPEDIYEGAAAAIERNRTSIVALGSTRDYHQGDRDIHESKAPGLRGRFPFAGSDESIQRAIFYLEVANSSSTPVLISAKKRGMLDALKLNAERVAHQYIESAINAAFKEKATSETFAHFAGASVELPSMLEMILARALTYEESLMDAAMSIRTSPYATAYRRYLHDLQKKLKAGRLERGLIATEMAKLKATVSEWLKNGDARIRIDYVKRELQYSKIPTIGWVTELANIKNLEINDPLLEAPPYYLTFVSNWFRAKEVLDPRTT